MILMQQNLSNNHTLKIKYLLGSAEQLHFISSAVPQMPFNENVIELLDAVSHELLVDKRTRQFSDVVTFAFWIRKASLLQMKKRFLNEEIFRLGKGLIFHIAPSNVAVNFAYSLAAGLLCGNANIIKAPSKSFEQVILITDAFKKVLEANPKYKPYITIVQYGHDTEINDYLSSVCDVRVIWGGDETIHQIRQSAIGPRATEVAFADRFSIAYIDAEYYLKAKDKKTIANDFYNDTYLTDQNACTSPRIVFWGGKEIKIQRAKDVFWNELHELVIKKYNFQDVCAVDKLCNLYLMSSDERDVHENLMPDNFIMRIQVKKPEIDLMKWKCHAGFFFEYDCEDIMNMREICDHIACQTLSYFCNIDTIKPLLACGIKGVDRIVPIGKTMDFDFIWDGYNLVERFTRIIDMK